MSASNEEDSIAPNSILRAWTPTTTQQLQNASSSCAFDVLDHVLEAPITLQEELAPWLSQLKPARTQGDVQAAEILSLLSGLEGDAANATTSRGDCSIFISRQARNEANFSEKHPCLSNLISSVESTVQKHLSPCITFDTSLTSVQLAVYPGDGSSGYPRHCDRSKACEKGMQRIVTAVYYVTPSDWNADLDGGSLRVYCGEDDHYDVVPYANRMVVFRSDFVDHQVMPSLRRERMALTIWLYGKVKNDNVVSSKRNNVMGSANNNTSQVNAAAALPPPLPVADINENNDKKTIFVSIAAYRDSELGPTLCSLMATAQHSKRVFVGIVLQLDDEADQSILDCLPTAQEWFQTQVRILRMNARHARGPCYARDLCQRLYKGEDYVLQTDSHMRFRPNWDSYLITQLEKCPSKSMLTTYPVGYQLPNAIPNETRGTLLVPWKFDEDGMLRQRGRLLQPRDTPVKCHLYAAGFNFACGNVISDCPYDGSSLQYLFFGEELSMAVRLYTHGYDLYAPPETVVYHLWSRSHRPTPIQETLTPEIKRQREAQRKAARTTVQLQLIGEGRGLGTERTAEEFSEAIGVDFYENQVNAHADMGGLEADEFANDSGATFAPESLEGQVASLDVKTQARIMSFLSAMNS